MVDNVLTNYDIKFVKEQVDFEQIIKSKLSYKIYNNKISEPLHKFWFSVSNIKFCNNYNNYKSIRFLMNNKNHKIINLINYFKDIGDYLIKIFEPTFPNISIDYPWKESEQFPYIFNFFTNNNTLFTDSNSNIVDFSKLSSLETYSIIFEISNVKILPIILDNIESFSLKINLSLILIKLDEKKDIRNYIFTNKNISDSNLNYQNINSQSESKSRLLALNNSLPFLTDISSGIKKLNSESITDETIEKKNNIMSNGTSSNLLIIDKEQLLKIKNTLKKVNRETNIEKNDDDSDDNASRVEATYIDKKNSLRSVKTKEKSLLNHLKPEKKKKKKKKNIEQSKIEQSKIESLEIKVSKNKNIDLENELEMELERELELELDNVCK